MISTILPVQPCSACGAPNSAHTHGGEATPSEGDYSICFRCGHVTRFAADLSLRELSADELADVPDEIKRAVEMTVRLNEREGRTASS